MTDETYIYDNTEVVKTGRKAVKSKDTNNKRSARTPPSQDILFEIKPADPDNGSWKKWVRQADLYEIVTKEH